MSAVIAADAAGAVPAKGGKKKLLVIVAVAVVVLLLLGAGTVVILKKRAAAHAAAQADDDSTAVSAAKAEKSHESMGPPTYLPLDPFIVNLADRDSERYAQIGITLEIENSVMAEQMRGYMPSIRNAILMVITRKSSKDLLDPHGKEELADEIAREAVRPMGIEIAAPLPVTSASAASAGAGHEDVVVSTKRHGPAVKNPIRHVNFSSFIIQ